MAKRGRPIKPDAKRNGMNIRLSKEENEMLHELSKKSGKKRSEVLVTGLKKLYEMSGGEE